MKQADFILAINPWARMRGLLGTSREEVGSSVLVIAPCRSIHTFGMRFSIDVAFVDKNGTVIRAERDIPRCKLLRCAHSYMVLERANAAGKPWFTCGDQISLRMQLPNAYAGCSSTAAAQSHLAQEHRHGWKAEGKNEKDT